MDDIDEAIEIIEDIKFYEYDAQKTVKRSKRFVLQLLVYCTLVLILSYALGSVVIDIGFWLFFPLALILIVIRGDYVKYNGVHYLS